ncbi:MAG: hypothetical protein U0U46_07020 [Saprospiraceae bacterium]|nr:hypothetical protein [Saprospiraceae bacterium]
MTTLLRVFVFAFILYCALWVGLRLKLYGGEPQTRERRPAPEFSRMMARTGRYHGIVSTWEVVVTDNGGDWLFNLVDIDNIVVKDASGARMRVFGNFPLPNEGEALFLKAEFKQIRFLPEGCGLNLIDVSYDNPDTVSPPVTEENDNY